MLPTTKFEGKLFKVLRHVGQHGVYITVLVEDDENWHEKMCFHAHWLPELIELLRAAEPQNEGQK